MNQHLGWLLVDQDRFCHCLNRMTIFLYNNYDEVTGDDLRLLSFFKEIINIYSSPGGCPWIFNLLVQLESVCSHRKFDSGKVRMTSY